MCIRDRVTDSPEVACRRDAHTALPLDWLHEDGYRLLVHGLLQRRDVTVRHVVEAGDERRKGLLILSLACSRECAEGPPVEAAEDLGRY